jgi:hypothetical protein
MLVFAFLDASSTVAVVVVGLVVAGFGQGFAYNISTPRGWSRCPTRRPASRPGPRAGAARDPRPALGVRPRPGPRFRRTSGRYETR